MLGIGMTEMLVIAAIALIVIGPEKFPEFAKLVVRTIRDIRGYVDEARSEIEKELRPVQSQIRSLSRYDPEEYIDKLSGSMSVLDEEEEEDVEAGRAPKPAAEERNGTSDSSKREPGTVAAGEGESTDAEASEFDDAAAESDPQKDSGAKERKETNETKSSVRYTDTFDADYGPRYDD